MRHLIMLGDSIFDNGRYVNGAPDVSEQLQAIMPDWWKVSSFATDGAITESVFQQIKAMPADATHIVLSVGGNDGLSTKALLYENVSTVSEALLLLSAKVDVFEKHFRRLIQKLTEFNLPLLVCAIYNANFAVPEVQTTVKTAIALYDDVIIRVANAYQIPVLDLRTVCTTPADYANPIEPSAIGGQKIANAIARHFEREVLLP